jgi:hypothetical protein
MAAAQLTSPQPNGTPGYRLPYFPFVKGVDQPNVAYFQGTLNGSLHKGVVEASPAASETFSNNASVKLPYAAVDYMKNPMSSSAFLHNGGCKCPGMSMGVDGACVGGRIESLPFAKKTQFQAEYLDGLLNQEPYAPLSVTEVATMMRAAPLPLS